MRAHVYTRVRMCVADPNFRILRSGANPQTLVK